MWPWDPKVKGSWKCSVALFTLIVELSDKAQPVKKSVTETLNARFTHWRPKETNLHKWSRFPREKFLTQTMFARSPLETKIKTLPLEIQQIIVTKVWQNRTIIEGTEKIKDFSNFVERDYLLSQYLEHTLLAPGGEQLMKEAQDAVRRIENVALGIYPAKVRKF